MTWSEREHPRDRRGRFAVKAGGWLDQVVGRLGRRRRGGQVELASGNFVRAPDLTTDGSGAARVAGAAYEAARRYHKSEDDSVLAGRMLHRGSGVGPHGDEALHHIAALQGFEGKPQVVTKEEMDTAVRRGAVELFRGVEVTPGGLSAEDIHRQFREGEAYQGLGFTGNGTYMSTSRSVAASYGGVGRYAIQPGATVADLRELQEEQIDFLATTERGSPSREVYADIGRYAAARGIDVIRWERGREAGNADGDEYVIINRTVVLAQGMP